MIFTSHRPEDYDRKPFVMHDGIRLAKGGTEVSIRHDPRPYFQPTRDSFPGVYADGVRVAMFAHGMGPRRDEVPQWSPRPEFTTPSNPILVEVRLIRDGDDFASQRGCYTYMLECIEDGTYGETVTPEQCDHARRVLTRLANLEGATS